MNRPARTWALVAGISGAATLGLLVVFSALERHLPRPFRMMPIPKIDVREQVEPRALPDAMRLAAIFGIEAIVNLPATSAGAELAEQLRAAEPFGGRVVVFARVDFQGCCGEEWSGREAARLALAKSMGARGVSLSQGEGPWSAGQGRIPLDSARLDPLWESCARLSLPVAIPPGDPRPLLELASPDPEQEVFDEFVRLVERHPRVTFIGAHFAKSSQEPGDVKGLLDRLPNLYVDTAGEIPELGRRAKAVREAILAHPDRVLFGTDLQWIARPGARAVVLGSGAPTVAASEIQRFFEGTFRFFETPGRAIPSPTPTKEERSVEGIALPLEVLEQVYHRNAERLLGVHLGGGA